MLAVSQLAQTWGGGGGDDNVAPAEAKEEIYVEHTTKYLRLLVAPYYFTGMLSTITFATTST